MPFSLPESSSQQNPAHHLKRESNSSFLSGFLWASPSRAKSHTRLCHCTHTCNSTYAVLELLNFHYHSLCYTERFLRAGINLCTPYISNQYMAFKTCLVNIYVTSLRIRGTTSISLPFGDKWNPVSLDQHFFT